MFNYIYQDKIFKAINFSKIDGGWIEISEIEKGRKQRKKEKEKKKAENKIIVAEAVKTANKKIKRIKGD